MWNVFWYTSVVFIVLLIVKYFWQRRKLYWLGYCLDGPPTVFLLGNGLMFNCKEEVLFQKMSNIVDTYSSPARFWLGPKLVIVLKTASDIEKVLTSPYANDKDDIYRFLKVFNGLSLFTTNGTMWKRHRRHVTPFLGRKYMDSYLERMKKNCIKLVEKLDNLVDKDDFDIDHSLRRCYNDIVTETLTGHNPAAQEGYLDYFIALLHEGYVLVHARMMKIWLHPDFLFDRSSNGHRQKFISNEVREFFKKSIRANKENAKRDNEFVSIYENLLQTQEKNNLIYKNDNLIDHLVTLFSASEDTTTTICSFLLVLLGMYPDVQNRVVQEIKDVIDEDIENLTFKQLTELKYLDMCVKEVIRLFPIGPYILRKLSADVNLGKVVLPKDTTVVLSFYNVQRSKEHWQKPNEFYPEHFLPEYASLRHPYAFLPFSAGPRSCPGQIFAYAAIKIVTVMVLQSFIITSKGKLKDIKVKGDISIRPIDGFNLKLRRR